MAILTFALISAYLTVIVAYAYFAPTVVYKTKAKAKAVRTGIVEELFLRHFRICEYRLPVLSLEEVEAKPEKVTQTTVRCDGRAPLVQTSEQPKTKLVVRTDLLVIRDKPFWAVVAVQVCTTLKMTPPARRIIVVVGEKFNENLAK